MQGVGRAVVYAAVLYASFAHNVFWVPDTVYTIRDGFRTGYLAYDSDLVVNRLALARDGIHPLHPLYWQDHQNSRSGFTYTSQFGLQGIVLAAIYRQVEGDVERFATVAGCVWAGLTAVVIAAFFGSVARRIGNTAGDVGTLLAAGSPILLPFATSLYWSPFLMLAPFVAAWLLYPRCGRSWLRLMGLGGLIAATVCLKALCGYEYITTVILAPVVAIVYHRAAVGDRVRAWVLPSMGVIAAGLLGFALALATHAAQLAWVVGKNPVETIGGRANGMTVGATVDLVALSYASLAPRPWFLPEAAQVRLRLLMNYFWLPATATPVTWGPARGFATLGGVVLAFAVAARCVQRRSAPPGARALVPAGAVGLLGGLSWHVLAHIHTCIHAHLNLICYFVPFALVAYALAGSVVEWVARRWRVIRFAPWVLAAGAVVGNGFVVSDHETGQAATAVEAVLHGGQALAETPTHAILPVVRLDASPREPASDLCYNCRLRPDYNGAGKACRVVTGYATGPPDNGHQPTLRIVAVSGGRVLPTPIAYARTTLLERILREKVSCTSFTMIVPEDAIAPGEPVRLFVVSGRELTTVAELPNLAR